MLLFTAAILDECLKSVLAGKWNVSARKMEINVEFPRGKIFLRKALCERNFRRMENGLYSAVRDGLKRYPFGALLLIYLTLKVVINTSEDSDPFLGRFFNFWFKVKFRPYLTISQSFISYKEVEGGKF